MCWLSGEPVLDEMLFDPTVITMMKRDGVAPDDLRVLLLEMSRRLKRHRVSPAPPSQPMPPVCPPIITCENTIPPDAGRA
jgi:hypothetical protein